MSEAKVSEAKSDAKAKSGGTQAPLREVEKSMERSGLARVRDNPGQDPEGPAEVGMKAPENTTGGS